MIPEMRMKLFEGHFQKSNLRSSRLLKDCQISRSGFIIRNADGFKIATMA